jgi:hypothetical protein
MRKNIEEMNQEIIRSNFSFNLIKEEYEVAVSKVNHQLVEDIKVHRNINGLTSKFRILRNFLKTKKFVKTTYCP